jgi:hypothetical protein
MSFRENPFPDVGRLCMLLPIRTEDALLFSARLDDQQAHRFLTELLSSLSPSMTPDMLS